MIGNEDTAALPTGHTVRLDRPAWDSGLVLEVIEGPMDGVLFAGEDDQIRLGRNLDNALSLHADLYVSGFHLLCRRGANAQQWILEDQGSSNGTFVEGGQLGAPHPITLGSTFILGHSTVVRCRARQDESNRTVSPETLYRDKTGLYESFAPELKQAFGAAAMLACHERRGFVNDRHLFLGLAMNQADLPLFKRRQGAHSPQVPRPPSTPPGGLENGLDEWVTTHLGARLFTNFFATELPWSPRVVWSILAAREEAERRGSTTIEPIDWFRAILGDATSRPFQVLAQGDLEPERLGQHLAGVAAEPLGSQASPRTTQPFTAVDGTGPGQLPIVVSSGNHEIDDQAQRLARRLDGLTAYYFLAEPEDRRQAMQELLRQELRQLEPTKHKPLLEQLQRLFPLDVGAPDKVQEVERLINKIRQLEHRIAELEKHTGTTSSGVPWHMVVEQNQSPDLDSLSPVDRPRIEFLREVFGFSISLERFIVGLAQGLTATGGNVTGSLALPGHRMSIKGYLNDMTSGRQVRQDHLKSYLQDMELWLLAGIAAYSESPKVWFQEFWEKASPTVIERSFSGWTRTVGLQHRELWQRYKDVTRNLNSDLVSQKIFHETKRIAQERRQQLAERRHPS